MMQVRSTAAVAACCAYWGAAVDSAWSNDLVVACDGYSVDYSVMKSVVRGVAVETRIVNLAEDHSSFDIKISPASAMNRGEAQLQAVLAADLTCLKLDARPVALGQSRLDGDAWSFSAGCEGRSVREDVKCH